MTTTRLGILRFSKRQMSVVKRSEPTMLASQRICVRACFGVVFLFCSFAIGADAPATRKSPPTTGSAANPANGVVPNGAIQLDIAACELIWHPKWSERTVDFKTVYKNSSDRPISFTVVVASGQKPRDALNDAGWRNFESSTFDLLIPAGESRTVSGTLPWTREADTMPALRYWSADVNDERFYKNLQLAD